MIAKSVGELVRAAMSSSRANRKQKPLKPESSFRVGVARVDAPANRGSGEHCRSRPPLLPIPSPGGLLLRATLVRAWKFSSLNRRPVSSDVERAMRRSSHRGGCGGLRREPFSGVRRSRSGSARPEIDPHTRRRSCLLQLRQAPWLGSSPRGSPECARMRRGDSRVTISEGESVPAVIESCPEAARRRPGASGLLDVGLA